MATIQVGVQARAQDVATATAGVNEASQRIVAALKALGLPEKDMQTRDLSVYEERDVPPQPMPMPEGEAQPAPEPRVNFVARNTLALTVHDLKTLPALLAAAHQAGANEVHGIHLGIDDPEPLEAQARSDAFANAQGKARQLAELGGARLGRLVAVEVIEDGGYAPRAYAMDGGRMEKSMAAVEAGEIKVQQRVVLHYAIQ